MNRTNVHGVLHLDGISVDCVVLLVSADKFYVYGAEAIGHSDYQSKVIALDVEHDSATFKNTGGGKVRFYIRRRFPLCISCLVNPGQERWFRVRATFPKTLQVTDGDDSHGMILVPCWD
ncbi:hypothetical protein D3C85_1202710 [compost metagenome]